MKRYILALDQGTTSSRAIVFDRAGKIVAAAQQEFEQLFPKRGHVEHDPEAIWSSQLAVAREVMGRAGLTPKDVAAIGITNQRETTILWERATGKPVANAIVWQSRASAGICDQLKAHGLETTFQNKTGLVIDAYFSGTKIKYLLDSVPGVRPRAEKGEILFGTVDSFLLWRYTGGRQHLTDMSNASRTLLFNIHTLQWDQELLSILGIPEAVLPEVRPSSELFGETDAALFGGSIPIAGIAGDQQAALFGQLCVAPGTAKNTYGTGCFALINTGSKAVASSKGLLTSVAWKLDGKVTYCMEGSVFVGGAVVQWMRDGLRAIAKSGDIEQLAGLVDDSGDVYFVPAFVGLGAPYWNSYARGTIIGLTRDTKLEHIARAALEAIAFQSRDVLDLMQEEAGLTLSGLKVDGGATANSALLQFQADVLGIPVLRPQVLETTALGAAYLAGLAVGYWKNADDIAANWTLDREFKPRLEPQKRDARYRQWRRAVERSLDWEEH